MEDGNVEIFGPHLTFEYQVLEISNSYLLFLRLYFKFMRKKYEIWMISKVAVSSESYKFIRKLLFHCYYNGNSDGGSGWL